MKKLLTFFLTALLAFAVGWAEQKSVGYPMNSASPASWSPGGSSGANTCVTDEGFTIYLSSSNATKTGYIGWNSGNTTMTISHDSYYIKEIVVNSEANGSAFNISLKSGGGTYTANSQTSFDWVAGENNNTKSVSFTHGSGSQFRITRITIIYETGGGSQTDACAAPTFSPNGGSSTTGSLDVTITSATEGATIYYTTDGTDPVVNRSSIANGGTVTLTGSCTLKAMAVKSGLDNSPIATSQSYTVTSGGGNSSTIYRKVTSLDDLVAGMKYIIVYETTPAFLGGISTTSTKYGLSITGPTITNNRVDIAGYSDIKELTLSGSSAGWSFHNGDGYLNWSSGNSLNISQTIDNNSKWLVSGSSTTGFSLTNLSTASSTSPRVLKYNSTAGQLRFACYTTGQKPAYLYVQEEQSTDPTLSVSNNNLSISVPYDQNSGTSTFTVTGANLGNNNVTVSVSGADFSVSTTSITPDANGAVNAETITVTYNGTSTSPVTGTVTVACGNLSETVTVTAQKELPPPPTMTATPAAVTFGTLEGGQLTVNANHLDADVNLSMLNTGYTTNTDKWTVTPSTIAAANGSEVSSAATVNYSGRLLKSDNTVRVSTTTSGVSNVDVPVHYEHNGPIYIVTSPNWDFTTGTQMNYSNGEYTYTMNATTDTYLVFTKKLGTDVGWDNGKDNSSLFGPVSSGDWWLTEQSVDTDFDIDSTAYHVVKMHNGTYTIKLNPSTNEMRIVADVHDPVFSPEPGRYAEAQTVTITSDTYGAHIYYTTDGTTPSASNGTLYSGPITVSETTTIKAVAVYGNEVSQEAEATYTIKPIGADDFFLVTSTNDVTANDDYVLVYDEAYAMGTTLSSSNGGYYNDVTSGFTVDNNVVSLSDGYTVNVFTLLDAGDDKFFMQSENGNYIGVNGNNLIQSTSTPTADTYKWSIEISNNSAVIKNASTNRYLAYNTTSPRYNTYQSITTNSAQQYASLYKRGTTQPRITVSPSTLDIVIPAGGTSESQTATVTETNTTGTTTVSITGEGASNFTASLSNGTLTVTYNGTAAQATPDVATVTLTNGTATASVDVTGYKIPMTVTITPASGTFSGSTMSGITLESNVAGATLEYRVDGGQWMTYSEAFDITASTVGQIVTVEARATYNGETATATGTYTRVAKSNTLFEKVTNSNQIKANNKYILVYEGTPEALNGVTTGGTGVAVEWHGTNVVDKAGTNAIEFTLNGTANSAVLSCNLNGSTYYLEPGSAPALDLVGESTSGYEWTIEENNGGYVLKWGNYMMRYNSGSSAANGRFRIYDGTTGTPVYLYVQGGTIQAPEITPATGTYYESQTVSINDESDDVTIWYTTDGSDPATSATRIRYNGQFTAPYAAGTETTIIAVAIDEEDNVSEPATVTYTWGVPTAVIAPATGNVATPSVTVAITGTPAEATIYYTTDGNTPTTESEQYNGAFPVELPNIGDEVTVKAIAVYNGQTSEVATATYTRVDKVIDVNAPFFSPLQNQIYYGNQTLQMGCTTPNADIHYEIYEVAGDAAPSAAYVNNPTNVSTYYNGQTINMTEGHSYYVKAIAYIGSFASTVSEGWYVIKPFQGGNHVYQNLKDFNDNCPTGVTATFANPVQVVYHSTYTNNGEFAEYCYLRDNTDYACVYFGKRDTHGYTIFKMGDWIDGSQIAGVTNIWERNFHIQLGTGDHEVTSWPTSTLGWSEIIPTTTTCLAVSSGTTDGDNLWGNYVHLRNTTLSEVHDYNTSDPKHTGTITDASGSDTYYDKFYLWSAGTCSYSGHNDVIQHKGDYDQAFFTAKQEAGATFDVYGIVDYYKPYEKPFEICPIDFLWIYQPVITVPSNDQCTAPFTTTITVAQPEWTDIAPTIYYKTNEMEDWEEYTPGQLISISSTTTVMTYAEVPAQKTDGTNYNDYLRSLTETAEYVFPAVKDPRITPPGETYDLNVTSSVDVTVQTNPESSTGTVTYYTLDGSDPRTSETRIELTSDNGTFTVSENTTVNAASCLEMNGHTIWSNVVSETYQFIENDGKVYDLLKTAPVVGDIYVIVNKADEVGLSTTQNATNRAATGVMFVEGTSKEKVKGNIHLATFVLEAATAGRYYLRGLNSNDYLCVTTNSNPNLMTGARNSYAEATVSVGAQNSDVDMSYPATVMMSYDGTRRYMRYYSAGRTFTTYDAATTNQDIFLYGLQTPELNPPTITPAGYVQQVITGDESVDATVATDAVSAQNGAKTVFTLDGSDPRYSTSAIEVEGNEQIISYINTTTTVRAASYIEYEGDRIWSDVVSETYTFVGIKEPIITPAGGLYVAPVTATITTNPLNTETGVQTWYTTDGSDPRDANNANRIQVTGESDQLTLSTATTVKAASCVEVNGLTVWSIVVTEEYQFTAATPLRDIELSGVKDNDYIVANRLIGTWAVVKGNTKLLWAKDMAPYESIDKRPGKTDSQTDYVMNILRYQDKNKGWDESNWVVLDFSNVTEDPDNFVGQYIAAQSVVGKYTDNENFTIKLSRNPTPDGIVEDLDYDGWIQDFEPMGRDYDRAYNTYIPANFMEFNLNREDENTGEIVGAVGGPKALDNHAGDLLYFMNPKIQEVARIWGVWNDDNTFTMHIAAMDTVDGKVENLNAWDLKGRVNVDIDWAYNRLDLAGNYGKPSKIKKDKPYEFHAAIQCVPQSTSGAMMRIARADGETAASGIYLIYPLDMKDEPVITAVQEVNMPKEVVGVTYYNLMGMPSDKPFDGINIVVTRYSDGSITSTKVLRR